MIPQFIDGLLGVGLDLTAREIADILWLASHMGGIDTVVLPDANSPSDKVDQEPLSNLKPLLPLKRQEEQTIVPPPPAFH